MACLFNSQFFKDTLVAAFFKGQKFHEIVTSMLKMDVPFYCISKDALS